MGGEYMGPEPIGEVVDAIVQFKLLRRQLLGTSGQETQDLAARLSILAAERHQGLQMLSLGARDRVVNIARWEVDLRAHESRAD